jgi:nucleotide-binding universal stress UspA family protein
MAGTGGGVQRTVRVGDSAQQIVAFAAEWGADLIVMGTRGKTGLSHALMGSVAEHVSRTAPCPVVTVKSSQAYEKLARAARKTSGKVPA